MIASYKETATSIKDAKAAPKEVEAIRLHVLGFHTVTSNLRCALEERKIGTIVKDNALK